MLGFRIRNLGENQRVKRSLETRAEKVGWKTARTQVDARRARRMSTVCGGARGRRGRARGRRGRARGPPLRSGPGEVVGGGRGVQARVGLGAEGPTDAPAAGGSREGGGPPAGRSCSRRLEGKFAAPGQRASGRPRPAPEPPPREGAPSSGWGPSVLLGGGLQPGAGRAERAKSPDSAGGPTPRAPSEV